MPDRHRRVHDNQNAISRALTNGLGALLSRLMIIIGFPLISALAAYAAALTMDKIETKIVGVADAVGRLGNVVDEVNLDAKATSLAVTGLRLDVTRLQDQQQNLSDAVNKRAKN